MNFTFVLSHSNYSKMPKISSTKSEYGNETASFRNSSRSKTPSIMLHVPRTHLPVMEAVNLAVVFEDFADKLEIIGRSINATELELRSKRSIDADMHHRPTFSGMHRKVLSSRRNTDTKHKPHNILTQHYRTAITRRITKPLPDTDMDDETDDTISSRHSRLHNKMSYAINNCYVSTLTSEGKTQRDRLHLQKTVQGTIVEMMQSSSFNALVEAVARDKSLKKERISTIQRNFENEDRKRCLKEEISNVSVTRRKEILAHERIIWTLEDLTQELQSKMALSQAYSEAHGNMVKKQSKMKCRVKDNKMMKITTDARIRLVLEDAAHTSMVDFISKMVEGRMDHLEYWAEKYSTDISEYKTDLETLHWEREQCLERIVFLKWNIKDLNQVVKDDRRMKAKKEQSLGRHETENKMATKIQALWRGYALRTTL